MAVRTFEVSELKGIILLDRSVQKLEEAGAEPVEIMTPPLLHLWATPVAREVAVLPPPRATIGRL